MTAKWLLPTIGYILALGALGVTSRLALRTHSWQDLVLWATCAYILASVVLFGLGQAGFKWDSNAWWAMLSAALVVGSLVFLYLALGSGDASKVIPVSASYPAVTLILAALFLSENVSVARTGGMALVVGGVVILTLAN